MSRSEYGHVVDGAQKNVGFFLSDSFNMLPFISAVEPLRIANRLSRKPLYQWSIISEEGQGVVASNGMMQTADYSVNDVPKLSMLMICGPFKPSDFSHRPTLAWLKHEARRNILIGGLETGCHLLSQAGLLNGLYCTTHWENLSEFIETYPQGKVSTDVYEIDSNRITCSGGGASMDMMLYIIEQHHGHELASSVADSMIHPHRRAKGEPQRMGLEARIGISHPALLECIELMESNIEQPLTPNELADLIGFSKRQLERLFRRYLNTTPARYYLDLRLEVAREMLEKSTAKVIDIALMCGFKSSGHFSSRYLSSFGVTPRETRK